VTAPAEALCPKCSAPRPSGAAECPTCGVIYARYARPRPKPVGPPPQAAATPPAPAEPRQGYVPTAQLEPLMLQLAELLGAGFTVRHALTGPLGEGLPAPIAGRLKAGAAADLPLSEILGPLGVVDPGAIALLRAGEAHGGLPEALRQVAQRLAERRAARRQLLGGLAYPALMVFFAVAVIPVPLLFTQGLGAYLGRVAPLLLLLLAAVLAFAYAPRLPQEHPLRRTFRNLGLAIPFVRVPLYSAAVSTFADVLGTSVKAGLPIREGLALATSATPHPTFEQLGPEVVRQLDSGATLIAALAPLGLPPDFATQVATGERAGTLDDALPRLARAYREHAQRAARRLLAGIGALAFAIAALIAAVNVVQGIGGHFQGQQQLFDRMERE